MSSTNPPLTTTTLPGTNHLTVNGNSATLTRSTPSPKSNNPNNKLNNLSTSTDQKLREKQNRECTAHTRQPWHADSTKRGNRNNRHRHDWWPSGVRQWAMWGLVLVVVGVLVTALVFAVDAGLRSAGVMSYAGARGGPGGGYDEHIPVASVSRVGGEKGRMGVVEKESEICCLRGMSCYLTSLSQSNIYCRPPIPSPITPSTPFCHPSFQFPPVCPPGNKHCDHTLGGGCCPEGTTCVPDGCVKVIEFVYPPAGAASTSMTPECQHACKDGLEATGTGAPSDLVETGVKVPAASSSTVALQPAAWTATVTGSKTGEVCDPSSVAATTGGPASGAARRGHELPSWGFFGGYVVVVSFLVSLGGVLS
ncbi:hypothetical protein GE09DRAFT_1277382 [Coniochaeta sp. 2T2.1]|nr:hypothetical protein GE09DRAFT_1277382 [Coniochaeta sp. 2T2.1]